MHKDKSKEKDLFVVLDPQYDFCCDGYYYTGTNKDIGPIKIALENIKQTLIICKARKVETICVYSHYIIGQFGEGKAICIEGTPGAKLAINKGNFNRIFLKYDHSVFESKAFFNHLQKIKPRLIYLAGFTLETCISKTCMDPRAKMFEICLVRDCIGTDKRRSLIYANLIEELSRLNNISLTESLRR